MPFKERGWDYNKEKHILYYRFNIVFWYCCLKHLGICWSTRFLCLKNYKSYNLSSPVLSTQKLFDKANDLDENQFSVTKSRIHLYPKIKQLFSRYQAKLIFHRNNIFSIVICWSVHCFSHSCWHFIYLQIACSVNMSRSSLEKAWTSHDVWKFMTLCRFTQYKVWRAQKQQEQL